MIRQFEIVLPAFPRGFHLITREILGPLNKLPQTGILHLFIKHTSAGLIINENVDPSVLSDFGSTFDDLFPDHPYKYVHSEEGPDDMPAHLKAAITGSSLTIPITSGRLNLGTWQGIYLCEFRNQGGNRKIVATIID